MRLHVDVRPALFDCPAGIGRTVRCFVDELPALSGGDDVVLLADREFDWAPAGVAGIVGPRSPAWHAWAAARLIAHRDAVHLSFSSLLVPALQPRRCVVFVHDLTPLSMPRVHGRKTLQTHRVALARCVRRAAAVVVNSRYTRDGLLRMFGVDAARIAVAPLAVAPALLALPDAEAARAARERLGVRGPYVLAVSTLEPRKNHATLLRAFALLSSRHGVSRRLVIAGGPGWGDTGIDAAIAELRLQDSVRFTGFVPDADLAALYAGADALAFVSLDEGFGLPVLEAMAHGTPVVAARTGAVPEVAGDAALYADPSDAANVASQLARVLTDPALAARLAAAGRARADTFSWRRFTRTVLDAAARAAP